MEIKSNKLVTIITDIDNSFMALTDVQNHTKPQELIKNAKVLESGEKKLKKEYLRHVRDIEQLQFELEKITEYALKFGYDFAKEDDTDSEDEEDNEE